MATTFINDKAVIVVGVDYSQGSNHAMEAACGLAGTVADVAVHIVHVTTGTRWVSTSRPPFTPSANPAPMDEMQTEKRQLEALTRRTAASVAADGIHLFGHLRTGNAAREIVQLASDLSAGLIVVGAHGRTGIMNLLLGSVAQSVLTRAACPVLAVRPRGLPRWPEIYPPCADCLVVQQSWDGQRLWCDRHSRHHSRVHTFAAQSEGFGLGAQAFRGSG